MKKLITIISALFCLNTTIMAQTETITLHVIETSDVHGSFFPFDFISQKPVDGSMARVSTYVNELREKYGNNVILLDNGDILQGQTISYYSNYIDSLSPNIASEVLNYLRYDAATVGNHDIETGHAVYDKWIRELGCPALGANIIDSSTGKPYVKPYTIIRRNGIKIAVLGLLTPAIPNWLKEELWKGLLFKELLSTARYWMNEIREQERPDIVIGLFHSGWYGGIQTDSYMEDASMKIAKDIPGFDLVLFGHDHTPHNSTILNEENKPVVCLNPANNAKAVAKATVTLTLKEGKVIDKNVTGEIVDVRQLPVNEKFITYFSPQINKVKDFSVQQIGTLEQGFCSRDAYFGSSAFIDFIQNLQLLITKADISLHAPLAFDVCIDKGPITIADMFKLYKYENQLMVMRMTGQEIKNHLEMSYDLWVNTMTSPDDHLIQLDDSKKSDTQRVGFKNLPFNFDSAAGIVYEVDVTKPYGQKVRILHMADGKPFSESKWYRVAVNSYRGNGGGELMTKGAGIPHDALKDRVVWESELDLRHYLIKEIERLKYLNPRANNNWRFVPSDWVNKAAVRDRELLFGTR